MLNEAFDRGGGIGLNCAGAYLTDPDTVNQLGEWHRKKGNQQDDFLIKLHGTPRQWGEYVVLK